MVLNVIFFCTINLIFVNTFFSTTTGAEYTCLWYHEAKDDATKFYSVFTSRIAYTKRIHLEVKEFVAESIEAWLEQKPDWFDIKLIPDDFLPREVLIKAGGTNRPRRRSSFMEIVGVGGENSSGGSKKVQPIMKEEEL